jgi:hypothetical protein
MSSASCSRQLSPPLLDGRRTPPQVAGHRRMLPPYAAARHQTPPLVTGCHRRSPDAAARRRHRSPDAATGRHHQSPDAAASHLMRSTASAVTAGRQLSLSADVSRSGQPLLPPSVSHTVDSPCCHCLLVLVLANSPCCFLSLMKSLRCFLEQ